MARRRKTESRTPIKPESKSLVRKSIRQEAKKKRLESGGDMTCGENTSSFDSIIDTNGKQGESSDYLNKLELHVSKEESTVNIENDLDKHQQNDTTRSESTACCENTIEETAIYEEMETESRVDCSQVSFNFELKNEKVSEIGCEITNDSMCANSNSYQIVHKGLSGLHVSELGELSSSPVSCSHVPIDNFNSKLEISSQNESEEHSMDNQINIKMDSEDTKLSSSSESSSDLLLPKTNKDATAGVRRSNRIKHIGLQKQRSRGRGLVVKPIQESQKILSSVCPAVVTECQEEQLGIKITVQDHNNIINCDSNANKPVKVKSRWRRSSELEMSTAWSMVAAAVPAPQSSNVSFIGNDISVPDGTLEKEGNFNMNSLQAVISQEANEQSIEDSNELRTKMHLPMVPEVDREMEERLSQFEHLKENLYLTERYTNKETKRMVCDCFLTEEEIQRGELGCGEDCLNRLLMIECGSRCIVGDRCTNRRFQNCSYAKCQVFRTEKKGFGLRAINDMNAGEFIMEYVGEVVDSRDFRRRAKEYSKDKNRHYYFMAFKSDQIIDATMKGNISRFINHSCDPNAETQKWTVNGELRIGFFNKKFVAAGEEITFDYHFQRYGKEAQKCFCEAANCRGWIGDNPEEGKAHGTEDDNEEDEDDEDDEDEEDSDDDKMDQVQVNEKKKKKKKKKKQVEKEKYREGRKSEDKNMEDEDLEQMIDRLCASGLKNRVHTLTLSRLMVRCRELQHRRRLLEVIQSGEQPCRRLFLDYHGLRLMWSYMMDVAGSDTEEAQQFRLEIVKTLSTLPIPNRTMLIDSKVLSVVDKWSKQLVQSPSGDSPDDESAATTDSWSSGGGGDGAKAEKQADTPALLLLSELAGNLLESWANLKEVFRIPKKERLEQMKEHEREADRGYKEDESTSKPAAVKRPDKQPLDEQQEQQRPNLVQVPRMSKFERRQLFALKVAKEEEERLRRQQEELWQQHQFHYLALGVDPYATDSYPQLVQWQLLQQQQSSFALQQQQPAVAAPPSEQPPPALDLPPKWKWARDKRGRVYYYHVRERVAQWLPPPPDHIGLQPDSEPDCSSSSGGDDDDETSADDESASDRDAEEPEDDEDEFALVGDDLDAQAAIEQQQRDEPPPPELDDEATTLDTRKRRVGLVQERIISPRREEDRVEHSKFKELKDKLRRQKDKSRLKEHSQQSEKERKHRRSLKAKSSKQSSQFKTISSDMSPTSERKIKDTFRINMAHVMVHFLNPYRKNDCKQGRITNTEDFKYLARKLTHFVLAKELKHCKSVDELECNDNVKHKAKDFVRKYMNKFGAVYQRDKDED